MRSITENQTKGGLAKLPCKGSDPHTDQMVCPLSLLGKQEEGESLILSVERGRGRQVTSVAMSLLWQTRALSWETRRDLKPVILLTCFVPVLQ